MSARDQPGSTCTALPRRHPALKHMRAGYTAMNTVNVAVQNASHTNPVGAAASVQRASCDRRDEGGKQGLITLVHYSAQRKHILWDTLGA